MVESQCGRQVWLGQPTDTKILLSGDVDGGPWSTLLSLGDIVRRPHLQRKFSPNFRDELGLNGPVMVDSGAFTIAQVQDLSWTVNRVADIYRELDADVLASLDYPPSKGDGARERIRKIKMSAKSFAYLVEHRGLKVMPVIHGRTAEEIELSCALTKAVDKNPPYVALGGVVPLLQQSAKKAAGMEFVSASVRTIKACFSTSRIHVFGAGSPKTISVLFRAGANSVDSVAWRHAAAFGSVYLPGGSQRLLPNSRKQNKSRPVLNVEEIEQLDLCKCPICTGKEIHWQLQMLTSDFRSRAVHNAWTVRGSFLGLLHP